MNRRYRPGRGGFDPEIAEAAARAKYVYRQRVVASLIIVAIIAAVAGVVVLPVLWVVHALTDMVLVGYLAYLRRQVRIENEIRQRRLARYNNFHGLGSSESASFAENDTDFIRETPSVDAFEEVRISENRSPIVGAERKPSPTSRLRRHAVVVDLDDEDPAFHELAEHAPLAFRRASGE